MAKNPFRIPLHRGRSPVPKFKVSDFTGFQKGEFSITPKRRRRGGWKKMLKDWDK
jgi:hypothetical protein